MKEKRMEENAQTEQELLEEQLQAITGGVKIAIPIEEV
jgi:hypothetical protein